jgi:hypothetical protein
VDISSMSAAMAVQATRGEVVNKYTAAVLADTTVRGKVETKRGKKSRFGAGGEGDEGGAAGGAGAMGGAREPDDPWQKYLEAPKPRLFDGGRVVVFVVGGITQPELATLERMSRESNREIVAGGTSLLTPRDLLEQLLKTDPGDEEDDDDAGGGTGMGGARGGAGGGGGEWGPGTEDY